jgi:hypothetical protein
MKILCMLLVLVPTSAMAASLDDLVRAYPDFLAGFDGKDLIWRDGTRMAVEDGSPNSLAEQMRLPYPAGVLAAVPESDPGRIRNPAFFDKMYGDCRKGGVTEDLVKVVWLPRSWGHTVSVTKINGIDRQLAAVSDELDALPEGEKKFLYPLGGTYTCRMVADTRQTSMHAWGAAIDINVGTADYWFWRKGAGYENRIPAEVVTSFERHGFIWGGKWAHYDTMHFEYRPELLGRVERGG